MKIELFAQGDYDNIFLEFEEIDIVGAKDINAVLQEVTDGNVITAKKSAVVEARRAVLGEEVDTSPRCKIDGKVYLFSETKRVVSQKDSDLDSVLVKNPDGEAYVLKGEKFAKSYTKTEEGYKAIDTEKKFVTVTKNICFKAPWGEMMFAPKGSKLCIEYLDSRDVYSVTNSAFESTYKLTNTEIANENE